MPEKIIRDPVHDIIAFRLGNPLDALLFRLIAAPEVQRLRRIRQLGMASLAYPGADHSRYSHSLGVMETARKILDQLAAIGFKIDPQGRDVCVVTALLHDLGHGPFSHVFERVSGIHHEEITRRVILDPDSEVNKILRDHDPQMPELIVAFLDCKPKRTFFCDIISSQLDADRFDYLLRDNLMTGARYGSYDLEWVIHSLIVDEATDRLAVDGKGISAVETYLQARFNMYRNVYFHRVVRSAEGMVKLALQRAKRLAVQRRLDWPDENEAAYLAMLGQRLSIKQFNDMDDIAVLHCFKLWANGDDPILAMLCRGLLFREVYKSIDLSHVTDTLLFRKAATALERMIADEGGEPAYEMFEDQAFGSGYESFRKDKELGGSNEILVRWHDAGLVPFEAVSPLSSVLGQQLLFRRLHVAPQWGDRAAEVIRSVKL